jgi:hypothetical protein
MRRILILLASFSVPLAAQWLDHRDPRTPLRNGKPDLTAPAPRLNGKPDLSGVWQVERTSGKEFESILGSEFTETQVDFTDINKYVLDVFWGLKPSEEPLRPAAVAILKERSQMPSTTTRCLPAGVPAGLFIFSFKMIQSPREVVIISEGGDPARQIHTDGRSLPVDPQPSWMGYSVGKWQGDTFAVETTGFREESWLDGFGHPRSETMLVRENFRRRDFGHMDLDVTIEDAKYYTQPIRFRTTFNLIPAGDVLEFVCLENEKDRAHIGKH